MQYITPNFQIHITGIEISVQHSVRACPIAERNDMIFQLQLLHSMKKDFEESRRKQWSDILQEEMHPLKRYRKDKFDYNDDDEDEVTYLDKTFI